MHSPWRRRHGHSAAADTACRPAPARIPVRLEIRRIFSGMPSTSVKSVWRADAPAPLPMRLQQEHIVGVEMRADAATVGGITDHQVVQPCVGMKRNCRINASAAASCRLTPCTSRVHLFGRRGQLHDGPLRICHCCLKCVTSRDSDPHERQVQTARRAYRGTKAGNA